MSHLTTFQTTEIKSKELLEKALVDMGFDYKSNSKVKTDFGEVMDVDVALMHEGKDIPVGFYKKGESLKLVADWWNLKITAQDFTELLNKTYSKKLVETAVANDNGFVNSIEEVNGEIVIDASFVY